MIIFHILIHLGFLLDSSMSPIPAIVQMNVTLRTSMCSLWGNGSLISEIDLKPSSQNETEELSKCQWFGRCKRMGTNNFKLDCEQAWPQQQLIVQFQRESGLALAAAGILGCPCLRLREVEMSPNTVAR